MALVPSDRKRKSGHGDGAKKAKSAKGDELKVPVSDMLKEHVRFFDKWLCLGCLVTILQGCVGSFVSRAV